MENERVAVVTGGAGGIGLAVTRRLAGEEISWEDEVARCYGVRPERTDESVFAASHELLEAALTGLQPPDGARAYLLGESRAMIALRPLVEAAGIAHENVFVKGYWNVGRPDRLAGRAPRS